jgi:uncharacterized protein HemY
MIYTFAGLFGLLLGGWRAKKRGGNWADIAQYAVGHGIAFMLVGFVISLMILRLS